MTRAPRRALASLGGSLLVCAAVLAVYLPTPGDYWIRYDNEGRIREAPRIRALTWEPPERRKALVEMFTSANEDQYQPFHSLSLAIDYALFGWNRAGFHAHAIALHAAAMVVLYLLALRIAGSAYAASIASLAVAVHPIMVEAVCWTVHRNQLLGVLWTIVGTSLYWSYAREPRRVSRLVLSMLAYGISLASKLNPAIVLLPFGVDLWQKRRLDLRSGLEKLPLACAAAALTLVNWSITQGQVDAPERSWAVQLAEAPAALVLNAANTLFPDRIALFYPAGSAWQLVGPRWIAVLGVGAILLAVAVRLWRRGSRGLLLALLVWAPLIAPQLAAAAYREYVTADRYACLSLVFLGLGGAEALARLLSRADAADALRTTGVRRGAIVRLALAVPVLLLGWTARTDARMWSDEVGLWSAVVARTPHPTAYGAMANALKERGRWYEAVDALEQAVASLADHPRQQVDPTYRFNLTEFSIKAAEVARGSDRADRESLARRYLELAARTAQDGLDRWPAFVELRYDRGWALLELGEYGAAARELAIVLEQQPGHTRARARLAIAQWRLGRPDLARAGLEAALRVDPRYPPALSALAEIDLADGRSLEAARLLLVLATLSPKDRTVHARFLAAIEEGASRGASPRLEALLESYLERFPASAPARSLLERLGASARPGGAPGPAGASPTPPLR